MVGAEDEADKHAVDDFVLFVPAFESGPSDESVLHDGVGFEPGPDHFGYNFDSALFGFISQNYLHLSEQIVLAEFPILCEIEVLGNKVHNHLLGLRTAHYDFEVPELLPV